MGCATWRVTLGLLATGDQLSIAEFLDPGAFVKPGCQSAAVLWTAFKAHTGDHAPLLRRSSFLLAWAGYCAAFAVMAYKVFWWQVELLLAGAAGMCLLPCPALATDSLCGAGGALLCGQHVCPLPARGPAGRASCGRTWICLAWSPAWHAK